jgi:biotin synthase
MDFETVLRCLKETDEARLNELWRHADGVRRERVGPEVHLRGLVEISNHCVRGCAYCGLRAGHRALPRYRMTEEEILDCARQAREFEYGTVVLQSGEDPGIARDWMAAVVRRIKRETGLAVTLSLGERTEEEMAAWREAGADRYLLRFETSDRTLYESIHPSLPDRPADRMAILRTLRALGYEIGSGVMVGIPGQTYQSLAGDILLFAALDLDMIGLGPFLPHPATPLGQTGGKGGEAGSPLVNGSEDQAPNSELMTYKMLALARIACPEANIPSTTALATINARDGRERGLMRGANVVMPNLTPMKYRRLYEIYPNKACLAESPADCGGCLDRRISSIGRRVGQGRGDSRRMTRQAADRIGAKE